MLKDNDGFFIISKIDFKLGAIGDFWLDYPSRGCKRQSLMHNREACYENAGTEVFNSCCKMWIWLFMRKSVFLFYFLGPIIFLLPTWYLLPYICLVCHGKFSGPRYGISTNQSHLQIKLQLWCLIQNSNYDKMIL